MHVGETGPTLESILHSRLRTLEGHTPTIEALRVSEHDGAHHFLLLDGDHPLGVVCTCDLQDIALRAPVRDALHRPAVTLDVTASIEDAARRMVDEVVGSVLVTREGQAIGFVTREDLARASSGVAPAPRCSSCGGSSHLKHDFARGLLCVDCRSRATPATADDELGGSG